ncbi:MAG: hypothetical protein ACREDR_03565 [Blastocatellia bacterium]
MVELTKRTIEVYALHQRILEHVATCGGGQELVSSLLPGFRCEIDDIFRI